MNRWLVWCLVLAGCAPAEDAASSGELPLLTLSEPTLEIGVLEGDDRYAFTAIESVLRLDDGSVAVSDGGATRISLFDPEGSFLRSWGSEGEGPGEFRSLSRLYPLGVDSLMAADRTTVRLSVFDLEGELGRQLDGVDLSRDTLFRLDSWLHGRFWVDGGLRPEERAPVRGLLDGLPPPRDSPGYRSVRVARGGGLWVLEPGEEDGARLWVRTDSDGVPIALVEVPDRFLPLDIHEGEVLGRWLGESDVHFVRSYGLTDSGESRPTPSWLDGVEGAPGTPPPDEEELIALMRDAVRAMATAQEIHYSSHFTYTTRADSLDFEPPVGMEVSFTHGTARGWAAVFTHPAVDRVCGLAYGFDSPPGWVPGMRLCAP